MKTTSVFRFHTCASIATRVRLPVRPLEGSVQRSGLLSQRQGTAPSEWGCGFDSRCAHLRRTRNTRADARGADVRWRNVSPESRHRRRRQGQQDPVQSSAQGGGSPLALLMGKSWPGRRFESAGVHFRFMPATPDEPLQPDAAVRVNVSRHQTSISGTISADRSSACNGQSKNKKALFLPGRTWRGPLRKTHRGPSLHPCARGCVVAYGRSGSSPEPPGEFRMRGTEGAACSRFRSVEPDIGKAGTRIIVPHPPGEGTHVTPRPAGLTQAEKRLAKAQVAMRPRFLQI